MAAPAIELKNIPSTTLYVSNVESLYFASLAAPPLPGLLTLDELWSSPTTPGYLLFTDAPITSTSYAAVEALVAPLAATTPPSFAWLQLASAGGAPTAPLLADTLFVGGGASPQLASDFLLAVPNGMLLPIAVNATAPVRAILSDGSIRAFVLEFPPQPPFEGQPASDPPNGVGITLPVAGDARGCFLFAGLYNRESPPPDPNRVWKDLYQVSLDPLRLFDPQRTFMRPTGDSFVLSRNPDGSFSIARVS